MYMPPAMARLSGFPVSPTPAAGTQYKGTNAPLLQILREPRDREALLEAEPHGEGPRSIPPSPQEKGTHQDSKVTASPLCHLDL